MQFTHKALHTHNNTHRSTHDTESVLCRAGLGTLHCNVISLDSGPIYSLRYTTIRDTRVH